MNENLFCVELDQATMVALELEALIDKKMQKELDIDSGTFENGREHGFKLWSRTNLRMVSFGNNRNSDDIVVYFGTVEDFDDSGVFLNDELYEAQTRYYAYRNAKAAARKIFIYLISVNSSIPSAR